MTVRVTWLVPPAASVTLDAPGAPAVHAQWVHPLALGARVESLQARADAAEARLDALVDGQMLWTSSNW